MKPIQKIGIGLLAIAALAMLFRHYFSEDIGPHEVSGKLLSLSIVVLIPLGMILAINFKWFTEILYDNREYDPNTKPEQLVSKIRLRAVLFNNIAIIIFLFTLIVIFISFFLLVNPLVPQANDSSSTATSLTVRIGASVLLIFLVQILFKVFKYLLRVASFYNARADAIEFYNMTEPKVTLDKLMDMFTPDKYDISELQQLSVFDSFVNAMKGKPL